MTTHLTINTSRTVRNGLFSRIWAAFRSGIAALDRERRVRITLGHLDRLSDHSLHDIGLSRDQAERVIRDQSVNW